MNSNQSTFRSPRFAEALRLSILTLTGLLACWVGVCPSLGQVPTPTPSSYVLQLSEFGVHLGSDAIDLTSAGDGTGRVFVSAQSGEITILSSTGASIGEFLDFKGTTATTGFINEIAGSPTAPASFRGLMYFDFHPDFATPGSDGFGKLYTGFQVDTSFDTAPGEPGIGVDYSSPIRNSNRNGYIIGEWQVDSQNPNLVDTTSFRQVMRFEMEGPNPHALGEIAFNPYSRPGDEDYGLLYAAIGDANTNGNSNPQPGYVQNLDNPFGSIIRINPLQNGVDPYSIPSSNPFYDGGPLLDDDGFAEEIYAYGFRDPQTFSFAKDSDNETVLLTFDIGAAEREEIDLVRNGGNYGWERFEGTSLLNPDRELVAGSMHSLPVVQYDHSSGRAAIIGGFLVSEPGNPAFQNKVVFSDLPSGQAFFVDYEEMLEAEKNGTQATVFEMQVALNETQGNFEDIFSADRGDARFGVDENDRLFIVSKQTSQVLLTNLVTSDTVFSLDLELVIDVDSGAAKIVGVQGATTNLKGYSLLSSGGGLNPGGWRSLQDNPAYSGWQEANPSPNSLSELNPTGSSEFGLEPVSLGSPITIANEPAFGTPASTTDTRFQFVTADGEVLSGLVRHEGLTLVNNLLLTVDPTTGEAELKNSSQTSLYLRGYSIVSNSGSLLPADGDWSSLEDQGVEGIDEASSTNFGISELAPRNVESVVLSPGEAYSLGPLFNTAGSEDLQLEFVYAEIVSPVGDYNDDGNVDLADYAVWRDSLGGSGDLLANREPASMDPVGIADYTTWKSNFGSRASAGELTLMEGVVRYAALGETGVGASVSVPEPATTSSMLGLIIICSALRRRRASP